MESHLKTNTLKDLKEGILTVELTDPFNEIIESKHIPSSLKALYIKSKAFTKGFEKDFSLRNIETIVFPFNYTLEEYLPVTAIQKSSLKEIMFGYNWNPTAFILPSTIEIVTFGGQFTDKANFFRSHGDHKENIQLYKKLKNISLGGIFNEDITPVSNPFLSKNPNLKVLKLSNNFSSNLDLTGDINLETIIFNTKFNRPDFTLNSTIEEIQFGTEFDQPFDLTPYKFLKKITLKKNFKSTLKSTKKFLLNHLDITKINEGFPIYEFSFKNIEIGELRVSEKQFFLLELYIEKIGEPYLVSSSSTITVVKNEVEIYSVSSRDFSVVEETQIKKDREENTEKYTVDESILEPLSKNPCLFSLIVKNKYYNVDVKYYDRESPLIQDIHRKYNGEFSESLLTLRAETEKVYNHKDFKPFDFFISSIYNIPLNKVLRGITDVSTDETQLESQDEEKTDVHNFFMEEETLRIIASKINNLFLTKVPRLKSPLIVRRSLSHDFFEKTGIDVKHLPVTVTEPGMMSTSLYIHPGFTYNQRSKNLNPTQETKSWMMVLVLPTGLPAFDANKFYNNPMEKEILLPAGLEYTIYTVIKDYKIDSKEAYDRIFLNKFTLWENEYKRRIENDKKNLNDTINIFFAYVTSWKL